MPLCLGASGSVRTNVSSTSASWAPDVHTFCPLTTKSSPSRTGAGAQRRQVGAGARLAHAERRGHLGPQDRHRPPLLLLGGAERDQRRGDDADALRVEAVVDASSRTAPRCGRTAAATVALRPPNSGGLPGSSQPLSNISRCQRRAHSGTWLTRPRPLQRLAPPTAGARRGTPTNSARNSSTSASKVSCTALPAGSKIWKDYCYQQNENTILIVRKLQSLTRWPRGGRGPQWQGVLRYSQSMFSPIGQHPSRR